MIKAIFFDIDGTLASFKTHQIPDSTFYTLNKLKDNGIKLFIATGRGKDGLDILQGFPFDGYITLNGQYCFTNDELIYENTIDSQDIQALLEYLKEKPFPCGFTEEHTKYFNMRNHLVDEIHAITHNDDHPARDCSQVIHVLPHFPALMASYSRFSMTHTSALVTLSRGRVPSAMPMEVTNVWASVYHPASSSGSDHVTPSQSQIPWAVALASLSR